MEENRARHGQKKELAPSKSTKPALDHLPGYLVKERNKLLS